MTSASIIAGEARGRAEAVRQALPEQGLFAGQTWRISPDPFALPAAVGARFEQLGRVLLQFYKTVNLLYRDSAAGKQPAWVADWLDRGKPRELIELQRSPEFKNEIPRVIRPDVLLTENGLRISELDSVPGGIGLTAWLNHTYTPLTSGPAVIGGLDGMLRGFESIFGDASRVHIVVSDEAATYRPEMEWIARQLGPRFQVVGSAFNDARAGDAVYRFFELFDLANVACAPGLFGRAASGDIRLTPPPKTVFEEKLLFALLWNRNLREFWRQNLGESFFRQMLELVPYTWIVDPTPIPPNAGIPGLEISDWRQIKTVSKRERDLILKVSGFSENAWGARGVYLGSDLSQADWSAAVDKAIASAQASPHVVQRFEKPAGVPAHYFDFEADAVVEMNGRARLCPYYFVSGEGDRARAALSGVLATICPADKKIIHGMPEAILAPCSIRADDAS